MFRHPTTGQPMKATLWLHMRYFFLTEEKALGLIAAVCFMMMLTLSVFFGYHCNLAWKNMTTNETYKKPALISEVKSHVRIFDELIRECNDWEEKETEMPRIILDGETLPAKPNQRKKALEKKVTGHM